MSVVSVYQDNVEGLLNKVHDKAEVLFGERKDVAPLYVSRTVLVSPGEGNISPVMNEEIRDVASISELSKVSLLCWMPGVELIDIY